MNDIEVELRQVSASTSEASLRSPHVVIDRPQEKAAPIRDRWAESFF